MKSRPSFAELIAFNVAVVGQAQQLARHYFEHAGAFCTQVGPHLRHIIEHYEALLSRRTGELVDYDHRARDREVEQSPVVAARRGGSMRSSTRCTRCRRIAPTRRCRSASRSASTAPSSI
jgi:hypothetical protein